MIRWTGGNVNNPDIVYLATRTKAVIEVNRQTGGVRVCKSFDLAKRDFCSGAKKVR